MKCSTRVDFLFGVIRVAILGHTEMKSLDSFPPSASHCPSVERTSEPGFLPSLYAQRLHRPAGSWDWLVYSEV